MTKRPVSILLLTQFFPPETGAAQNRLACLVRELTALGADVTVMTAMPNYPTGKVFGPYRRRWLVRERHGSAVIIRSWIWVHGSRSVGLRGLSFLSFCATSLLVGIATFRSADLIIWESPPLPLGVTAWILAKVRGARLVTNVSDLWTESLLDLGLVRPGALSRAFDRVERFLYRASTLVSGQTEHIVSVVDEMCPSTPTYLWRNGAGLSAADAPRSPVYNFRQELSIQDGTFVVGFAGLIGRGQGLEVVVEAAELLRDVPVTFVLVGDGPDRETLMRRTVVSQLPNILWRGPVPHDEMAGVWNSFDCALVCLRRGKVFRGAVPSKLYEAMGAGLPIILAIEGEAEQIVRESDCGIVVKPEDPVEVAAAIRSLLNTPHERERLGANGRQAVLERFNRSTLTREFAERLLKLCEPS